MAAADSPVTVIVRHSVEPGKEAEFEQWMRGIVDACSRHEGYLNTEVIRPVDPHGDDHVCIFRFDTFDHLEKWMESEVRQSWLEKTSTFSRRAPRFDHYHSLEFWFAPERHKGRAPSRIRMAVVTFMVIWPMVHFIPRFIASRVPAPRLVAEALGVMTIVVLMTWVVMPAVTRLFEKWLYREP